MPPKLVKSSQKSLTGTPKTRYRTKQVKYSKTSQKSRTPSQKSKTPSQKSKENQSTKEEVLQSFIDKFDTKTAPPEEKTDHISPDTINIPASIAFPLPDKITSNMSICSHRTNSSSNQSNYVTIEKFEYLKHLWPQKRTSQKLHKPCQISLNRRLNHIKQHKTTHIAIIPHQNLMKANNRTRPQMTRTHMFHHIPDKKWTSMTLSHILTHHCKPLWTLLITMVPSLLQYQNITTYLKY